MRGGEEGLCVFQHDVTARILEHLVDARTETLASRLDHLRLDLDRIEFLDTIVGQ